MNENNLTIKLNFDKNQLEITNNTKKTIKLNHIDIDGQIIQTDMDSRGYTGYFTCTCPYHAYHSNCKDCGCQLTEGEKS